MNNISSFSVEKIKTLIQENNDTGIIDLILELLRFDDLSNYEEIIKMIVQYAYDLMHVSQMERLIYLSEPIKRLLKKSVDFMSVDDYYDFSTMISYLLDDFETALSEFDEYYQLDHQEPYSEMYYSSKINYVITNFKLNRLEDAKNLLREIEELTLSEPKLSKFSLLIHLIKAEILMEEGKLDQVESILTKSLEDANIDFVVHNKISCYSLLSRYYDMVGKYDEAVSWYEASIQLIEENKAEYDEKEIFKHFAQLLHKYGYYEKSSSMYATYVSLLEKATEDNRRLMRIKSELELYIKEKDDEAYHLMRENQRIKEENNLDFLTGIYNKRYMRKFLTNYFHEDTQSSLILYHFDIDDFKIVNDTYGHMAGDYVIKDLCTVIKSRLNADAVFARTGGDEFMICFTDLTFEQAVSTTKEIAELVKDHRFVYDQEEICLSVSGGLVSGKEMDFHSPDHMIKLTDDRLYESKRCNRGQVTLSESDCNC